jgi:hypothetical protein
VKAQLGFGGVRYQELKAAVPCLNRQLAELIAASRRRGKTQ